MQILCLHGANKLNFSNRQRTPEKQKKTPMERGGSQGPLPVIIKTSGNSGNIIIIKLTIKKNVELIHYLSDSIVFQIQIIKCACNVCCSEFSESNRGVKYHGRVPEIVRKPCHSICYL